MHIEMSSNTQEQSRQQHQQHQQRLPYQPLTLPTHRQACIKRTWRAPVPGRRPRATLHFGGTPYESEHDVLHIQDMLAHPALLSMLDEQEQRELWQAAILLSSTTIMAQQEVQLPLFIEASEATSEVTDEGVEGIAQTHHVFPFRTQPLLASTTIPQAPPASQRPRRGKLPMLLYLLLVLFGAGAVVFLYLFVPAFTTLVPFFSTFWGRVVMAFELLGLAELLVCRILAKTTKR